VPLRNECFQKQVAWSFCSTAARGCGSKAGTVHLHWYIYANLLCIGLQCNSSKKLVPNELAVEGKAHLQTWCLCDRCPAACMKFKFLRFTPSNIEHVVYKFRLTACLVGRLNANGLGLVISSLQVVYNV